MAAAPTPDELVGKSVRALRLAAGLAQRDIAEGMRYVGFAWERDTVAQLEAGRRRLGLDELAALAAYFELPPTALIVISVDSRGVAFEDDHVDAATWVNLWMDWPFTKGPSPTHKRRAIDALFRGLRRPWAEHWRRERGHPASSYIAAREHALGERQRYPGPIYLPEDDRVIVTAAPPWGAEVKIKLQPLVPYVARDELEAEALDAAAARGEVRKIPKHTAHYLRQKQRGLH